MIVACLFDGVYRFFYRVAINIEVCCL